MLPLSPMFTCRESQASWNTPIPPVPCVFSSRWAFSIKLSVESAVTSTSSLHHIQHLCKHRATTAKHRCWQTVNTPHEQCASFNKKLNCLLVLSPPRPQRNHVGLRLRKKDGIDYSPFSKQKDGDREGMSVAPVACFCFGCSRHEIIRSTNCAILQHLSAASLRALPNVTGQLAFTEAWQWC